MMSFASVAVLGSLALSSPASALTMKECSTKYQAAKEANTLNGQTWNDFRASQCGTTTSATTTAPAATTKTTAAASTDVDTPDASRPPAKEPAKATMAAPAGVSFPKSIDGKYASETPAKGRFHTCVDAYHVNKDKNTLGGLKWIQKGGGFYSLCNAKLKS
jgi:hypothetical protein